MPIRPSALLAAAFAFGLASSPVAAQEQVLRIYNWSDYIAADTIARFESETGIKITYDVYDSNDILEAKLLAGKSGYDLVFPSATPYFANQLKAGLYQKLDKSRLPNAARLDPEVMTSLAAYDAGNEHAVPYMMAGTGVGYNIDKLKALIPDAALDSWSLVFQPRVLARIKGCGVTWLDAGEEALPSALAWLGRDPKSQSTEDLQIAADTLMKARPTLRYIHSSSYINDLANGEICVAMGYAGDLVQARSRAREAGRGVQIGIFLPKEGAPFNIDVMAIPKDAPNVANAHRFIDFLLRPEVIAQISNEVGYANAVTAATPLLRDDIRNDPVIYPPAATKARLFSIPPAGRDFERTRTRTWTRIKTRY